MPNNTTRSRRTTLGPVCMNRQTTQNGSTSLSNRRKSTAGTSNNLKKTTRKSRMSMAPRVGTSHSTDLLKTSEKTKNRRKSLGHALVSSSNNATTTHHYNQLMVDPRPINEKSFQQSCIRNLLQFLVSSGYNQPISHKILARPSTRDFNLIVTFLLRKIDPNFGLEGSTKFEDEVVMVFKGLKYPFPISKTGLVAAGSPHTWPSMLAALTWFVDFIQCSSAGGGANSDSDDELSDDEENTPIELHDPVTGKPSLENLDKLLHKNEHRFFSFFTKSYTAFISSDDDLYDFLEDEYFKEIEYAHGLIENEIGFLSDLNGREEQAIEELKDGGMSLPDLEKKREDLCIDLEKYQDLVEQYKEHKSVLQRKVNDLSDENDLKEKEFVNAKERVQKLKELISTQELSVEDVQKLNSEKKQLKALMDNTDMEKEPKQKLVWEMENTLEKKLSELKRASQKYNHVAKELLSDEYFYVNLNEDNLIDLEDDSTTQVSDTLLLGVNLKHSVIPTLHRMKQDYESKTEKLRILSQKNLNSVATSETDIASHKNSVKEFTHNLRDLETLLREEQTTQESELESLKNQIKSLEVKTESLRDPKALEEAVAMYQSDFLKYSREKESQKILLEEEKEAVHKEINDALSLIANHKEYTQAQLNHFEEYAMNQLDRLENVEFNTDTTSTSASATTTTTEDLL